MKKIDLAEFEQVVSKYLETDTIDVDYANTIVAMAESMASELKIYREQLEILDERMFHVFGKAESLVAKIGIIASIVDELRDKKKEEE